MKTLIVLCVVIVAALAEEKTITTLKDLYASSSHHDKSGIRIINGLPAEVGQFPWQVALLASDGGGTHLCGGTLIDNQWVATAAHCADGAYSFTLYFGRLSLGNQEEGTIAVVTTEYVVHPEYSYQTLNNDIALIRLPEPIVFTDRIRAIRLPEVGEVVPVGSEVTVSGWGQTSEQSGSVSDVLNYVHLNVISNAQCASIFTNVVVINSTVCALGTPPYKNTCNGDSGGPLVLYTGEEATLHGLVSFVSGSGCAVGFPSGYVRVEAVRSWIREVIGN